MKNTIIAIAVILITSLSLNTFADEKQDTDNFILGMQATAKMTGICGILQLQGAFQDSTKMDGGTEFMKRFWVAEAARMGLTFKEYVAQCVKVMEHYKIQREMFTTEKGK